MRTLVPFLLLFFRDAVFILLQMMDFINNMLRNYQSWIKESPQITKDDKINYLMEQISKFNDQKAKIDSENEFLRKQLAKCMSQINNQQNTSQDSLIKMPKMVNSRRNSVKVESSNPIVESDIYVNTSKKPMFRPCSSSIKDSEQATEQKKRDHKGQVQSNSTKQRNFLHPNKNIYWSNQKTSYLGSCIPSHLKIDISSKIDVNELSPHSNDAAPNFNQLPSQVPFFKAQKEKEKLHVEDIVKNIQNFVMQNIECLDENLEKQFVLKMTKKKISAKIRELSLLGSQ